MILGWLVVFEDQVFGKDHHPDNMFILRSIEVGVIVIGVVSHHKLSSRKGCDTMIADDRGDLLALAGFGLGLGGF